jgi:Xaa-Pro aminopeptidase
MATPEAAREISGVRDVSLSSDTGLFQEVFSGRYRILTKKLPQGAVNERMDEFDLFDLLKQFKEQTAAAGVKTDDFRLGKMLARLREIKSDEELVLMQKAIDISVDAHMEMMAAVRPGMFEYEVEAKGEYVFHRSGAEDVGYPSICGSAGNSVILHYDRNRRKLNDGDLILLDMGAEYHGYTADITRTLPVSGKFSPEQLQLYSLVLEAQEAGIAECRAGKEFRDPHRAALKTIEKGLIKLGIIEEEQQAREYFPHGTSHYLGLDVHDAGSFGPLQDRQVITVEPGIYIPSGSPCDPKWWGIGIRIEDDVLITPNEPVVLSGRLPKDPFLIEKLIKQGK